MLYKAGDPILINKEDLRLNLSKASKSKGPANVIPFPKKPPHLKADGGSIDKALSGRSRDI